MAKPMHQFSMALFLFLRRKIGDFFTVVSNINANRTMAIASYHMCDSIVVYLYCADCHGGAVVRYATAILEISGLMPEINSHCSVQ